MIYVAKLTLLSTKFIITHSQNPQLYTKNTTHVRDRVYRVRTSKQ